VKAPALAWTVTAPVVHGVPEPITVVVRSLTSPLGVVRYHICVLVYGSCQAVALPIHVPMTVDSYGRPMALTMFQLLLSV
jgi:hypothetical protein